MPSAQTAITAIIKFVRDQVVHAFRDLICVMLMDAFLAINHLLNFAAPAFWLAFVLVLISHIFFRKQAKISGWIKPVAINFAVGLAVLLLGLWFFGNDGKMFTYGALVVVSATCQWLSLRSWRE